MYKALLEAVAYRLTRAQAKRMKRSFEHLASSCAAAQRETLLRKLRRAASTEYGRRFGFSRISSPEEYRAAVPIVDYEAITPYVERIVRGDRNILFPSSERLLMFAMTSGTTASPKYVPVTETYFHELKRGNFTWGIHLMHDHPRVIDHSILHVVSPSREGETPGGVPCGAATGLVAESQKLIARLKYAMPVEVCGISDYATKYACIMRLALQRRLSLVIAANPSTLVALGRCLEGNAAAMIRDLHDGTLSVAAGFSGVAKRSVEARLRRDPARARRLDRILSSSGRLLPRDVWPEVEVIACWTGGTLTPYLDLVKSYWGGKPLRDPGLIASEGRMTIPIEDGDRGGVLDICSHFYEFLPYGNENGGDTLLAHELEMGRSYYIILTTSSGFFRYNISDLVEVSGFFHDTPILRFLHKGSRISSLTGEKISERQVVDAFRACERRLGFSVPQFTVCPRWDLPPRYLLLLEEGSGGFCCRGKALFKEIAARFDDELKALNGEYRGKRDSGRLGSPVVRLLPEGSFDAEKAAQISRSGGRMEQYKHPYLSPSLDYCSRFHLTEP